MDSVCAVSVSSCMHEFDRHHDMIEIKPCTDNCGDLRIEPVTIEKHVDLAFTIFECIFYFFKFCKLIFASNATAKK